jgi:hypothetical protein
VADGGGVRWERRVIDYHGLPHPEWASETGWYPVTEFDVSPAFTPPLSFGRLVMWRGPVDLVHGGPGVTSFGITEPPLHSMVTDRGGDVWQRRHIQLGPWTQPTPEWITDTGWYAIGVDHEYFHKPLSFGELVALHGPLDLHYADPGDES